jgi:hypothetical protein
MCTFAKQFQQTMELCLEGYPLAFANKKLASCRSFCLTLHQQASIHGLAIQVKKIFDESVLVEQLILDLSQVDIEIVSHRYSMLQTSSPSSATPELEHMFEDIKKILVEPFRLDMWIQWLHDLLLKQLEKCNNPSLPENQMDTLSVGQTFLQRLTLFNSLILNDMISRNCSSLRSLQILFSFFLEFLTYALHKVVSHPLSHVPAFLLNHFPPGVTVIRTSEPTSDMASGSVRSTALDALASPNTSPSSSSSSINTSQSLSTCSSKNKSTTSTATSSSSSSPASSAPSSPINKGTASVAVAAAAAAVATAAAIGETVASDPMDDSHRSNSVTDDDSNRPSWGSVPMDHSENDSPGVPRGRTGFSTGHSRSEVEPLALPGNVICKSFIWLFLFLLVVLVLTLF